MSEETSILGGQNRVLQVFRNLLVGEQDPFLQGELAQNSAVFRENIGDNIGPFLLELFHFRQIDGIPEQ